MKGAVARLIQVEAGVVLVPWLAIGWFVASTGSAVDDAAAIVHASVFAGLIVARWLARRFG